MFLTSIITILFPMTAKVTYHIFNGTISVPGVKLCTRSIMVALSISIVTARIWDCFRSNNTFRMCNSELPYW